MPSFTKKRRRLSASRMCTVNCGIIPRLGYAVPPMVGRVHAVTHPVSRIRAARWWLAPVLLVVATLAPCVDAMAGDRTNLPLKNWGGFPDFRDATYDDLERLVTAELADRTLLNTKPLSRIEAARIVARAIRRIRSDEPDRLNLRHDLEAVLQRRSEEGRVELAARGGPVPDGVEPAGTR